MTQQATTAWFTVYDMYTEQQCDELVGILRDLEEWRPGAARTKEATDLLKHNLELKPETGEIPKQLCYQHGLNLSKHHAIRRDHLIRRVSPPKFNWYKAPAGDYRRHCDSHSMHDVRTDLACTTFLTDPDDCVGGELNLEDWYGNVHTLKGKKGQCVVYQCGRPHWVTQVTEGERMSVVCWIQSHVQDFTKRQVLAEYGRTLMALEPHLQGTDLQSEWIRLGAVQAELLRMWMGT